MDAVGITLFVGNAVIGLVGAWVLARLFGRIRPGAVRACFVMFLGVYFIESCAVAASMATMVLPIAISFFWARIFGMWLLKSRAPLEYTHRAAFGLAVYTGLPALSLVLIPIVAAICSRSILNSAGGISFGIPAFLPWPFCSILGFFGTVSVGAFVLKVWITTRGMHSRMAAG